MGIQGVLAVANGPRGTAPHLVLQTPGMQAPYVQMRPPGMQQQAPYPYRPGSTLLPGVPVGPSLPQSTTPPVSSSQVLPLALLESTHISKSLSEAHRSHPCRCNLVHQLFKGQL